MVRKNNWFVKGAHKKLLEHFESQFPAWIKAPLTGILNSFFDSDLEKIAKDGYLDMQEIFNAQYKYNEKFYRLSMKGFSELSELKAKRWFNISVIISLIALAVSIIGIIGSYYHLW